MNKKRLLTLMGGSKINYIFRDEFSVDVAAGSVNGSNSVPGISTRTVIDTDSKISISSGKIIVNGAKTPAAYGDPGLWFDTIITRAVGQVVSFKYIQTDTNPMILGVDNDKSSSLKGNSMIFGSTVSQFDGGVGGQAVLTLESNVEYIYTLVLRSIGAHHFIRGGTFTNQELIWTSSVRDTASLYAGICGNQSVFSVDYVRVPSDKWMPTPLLSDGFSSIIATDGLGHAEGVAGALGGGGSGKEWTQTNGTWEISSDKGVCSTLDGGLGIATCDVADSNVNFDCTLARTGDNVGLVLRYVDAENYIYAIHDGTNASLIKKVANSDTTVATAAVAFGDGNMKVMVYSTTVRMYWNGTLVQAAATIGDAVLQTSGKHGLYTTNIANTFDNAIIFARGN